MNPIIQLKEKKRIQELEKCIEIINDYLGKINNYTQDPIILDWLVELYNELKQIEHF